MRVLRIGTLYLDYWTNFYKRRPGLQKRDYAEQLSALFNDFFAQSDSYSHYLRQHGYDCQEVLANVQPLQKTWARENGIGWNQREFVTRLPLEFARRFRPDIVFVNNFSVFGTTWIKELKALCPTVRLSAIWCASPISSLDVLSGYDLVLTSSPAMLRRLRSERLRSELLRHAFDPRILGRIDSYGEKNIEFSFIGSINRGDQFHNFRAELIRQLIKHLDLSLFCPNNKGSFLKIFLRRAAYDVIRVFRLMSMPDRAIYRLPLIRRGCSYESTPLFPWQDIFLSLNRGAVYGLKMYETLSRSRLTLNVHIDQAGDYTGNMRLFEATGVGTCLLTDWKKDLPKLFEPDLELVTYESIEECIEKARWLLTHPHQCSEIAEAGQRRTLREHTYEQRVAELDHIFRKELCRA